MANMFGYNQNQGMINQLLRQKDNIDNMIQQYSQPPVQNIINTSGVEFEARVLKDDEDIETIFINHKTMFLDKKNKKVLIKDVDGKVLEEFEIIIPLDEKDKKILELENKLKEMERTINDKYEQPIKSNDDQQQPNAVSNEYFNTTAKTNVKSIQKPTR